MSSIGDERTRDNVYFMMPKFQYVWLMRMRITIVLMNLIFLRVEGLKIKQRAAIRLKRPKF
jgi:hypothetical protein